MDSRLSLGDKLVLLRDLAWRLSDNNRSEISLEQAERYVGRKLSGMRHLEEQDGVRVLDQLRSRSGVLRSPAVGRLDFVHRTFQEYLAAEEATEEDRVGNLVGRAHLDIWRETIIMAAGHANRPQREELLGGILDRAQHEPRHARRLRLLAAACQETLPESSAELAGRLDEAVAALLPARRETDPPALAAVGPSLLRRLPHSLEGMSRKASVQTVRTVALIGGQEALKVLAGYVQDERDSVIGALIRAWGYFDADAYVDQVLSHLPLRGRDVGITHSGQWPAVRKLASVECLSIHHPIADFTVLGKLPPLKRLLVFAYDSRMDLGALGAQPSLTFLALMSTGTMRGLEALGALPQLRHLYLTLTPTQSLDGLRLGPSLSSLSLWGLGTTTDLAPLADHPTVASLDLSLAEPCLPIGLHHLSSLRRLERLSLHSVDVAAWLKSGPLPPNLKSLGLYDCVLPDDPHALDLPGINVIVR